MRVLNLFIYEVRFWLVNTLISVANLFSYYKTFIVSNTPSALIRILSVLMIHILLYQPKQIVKPLEFNVSQTCLYTHVFDGESLEVALAQYGVDLQIVQNIAQSLRNIVSYEWLKGSKVNVQGKWIGPRFLITELQFNGFGYSFSLIYKNGECVPIWNTKHKCHHKNITTKNLNNLPTHFVQKVRRWMKLSGCKNVKNFTVGYTTYDKLGKMPTLNFLELKVGKTPVHLVEFENKSGVFNEKGKRLDKIEQLEMPVVGRISSRYGFRIHPIFKTRRFHDGIDIAAKTGTKIITPADGIVKKVDYMSGYGNYVEIEHAEGLITFYGHLHKFARGIHKGSKITKGTIIGYVGSTGIATSAHLHYGMRKKKNSINPQSVKCLFEYLDVKGMKKLKEYIKKFVPQEKPVKKVKKQKKQNLDGLFESL